MRNIKVEVLKEIDLYGFEKFKEGAIAIWEVDKHRVIFLNSDVMNFPSDWFAAYDEDLLKDFKDSFKIGDGSLVLENAEEVLL